MSQVTKIYKLETLGFKEIMDELKAVDREFQSISKTKQEINKQKLGTQDSEDLKKLNVELAAAKIRTAELRLEKQRLTQEGLAQNNVTQAEINNTKASTAAAKAATDQNKAEAGSLTDIITQKKLLNALIQGSAINSFRPIDFGGKNLTYQQAIEQFKTLELAEKNYLQQSEISTNAQLNQANRIAASNMIEADSYVNVLNRRKALQAAIAPINPNSGTTIQFEGQVLSYVQAQEQLQNLMRIENEYIQRNRVVVESEQAEVGSLTRIIAQRKELQTLISNTRPGADSTIDFRGTILSYNEAIQALSALKNLEAERIAQVKGVVAANQVEAGSYAEIVLRQKELYAQLKVLNSGTTQKITFQGNEISFEQGIAEYKRLSAAEQDFRRQFQKDATLVGEYTTGIVNAFKKMGLGDLVGGQVTQAEEKLNSLNSSFEILKTELASLKSAGAGTEQTNVLEGQLIRNRNEAIALDQELLRVKTDMRGMGDVGNQVSSSISKGFQQMGSQLKSMLLTYIGFQAAFQGVTKLLSENEHLSDSFADLQIRIKGSKADVEELFESLKKIDTRTSLTSLVDIANVVAKKGVARDEIAGITQSLDRLFVVLGHEAGDPATATASIVKLITIFNDDKHVTAQRVDEIGTSLFKLTTSGVATGEFLVNFAERVGAVRGITGLTLPNILGMGAALQQLGQRSEVAGTASVQLATKMFSNVPKFAEAAGKSVEDFKKLLKDNPFEALVTVAENLRKAGDSINGPQFEEIIKAFGEVGISGARIKTVLADIATNGEFVRQKMKAAAVSTEDYGNQTAAAELKQHSFAATVDRILKQFEILGTDKRVQATLSAIANTILTIIRVITAIPFSLVIAGLTAMTAAWLFYKGNLALATLQQSANNEATLLGFIRLNLMKTGLFGTAAAERARAITLAQSTIATSANSVAIAARVAELKAELVTLQQEIILEQEQIALLEASSVLQGQYNVEIAEEIFIRKAKIAALEAEVVATEGAVVATEALNVATKASPLGALLTVIALIVPAISLFAGTTDRASQAVTEQNRILRLNATIQGEVAKQVAVDTANTIVHVNQLVEVLKTQTGQTYLLKGAYDRLIEIAPEFIGIFDGEKVNIEKLNELYPIYIKNIQEASRAKALAAVRDKFVQEQTTAEVNAFEAKLKADQEKKENAEITRRRELIKIVPTGPDAFTSAFGTLETDHRSDAAQKDFEAKDKLAKDAAAKNLALDKFLKQDLTERQTRIKGLQEQLKNLKSGTAEFNKVNDELEREKKNLLNATGIDLSTPKPVVSQEGNSQTLEDLKARLADVKLQIAELDKIKNLDAEQSVKLKGLRKQRTDIQNQIKELSAPKTPTFRGSRLTGEDKDALNIIQAQLDQELALRESQYARMQIIVVNGEKRIHKLTYDQELEYVRLIESINLKYIDQKIATFADESTLNAKELQTLNTFRKQRADVELKALQDTISIKNREFEEEKTILKARLDEQVKDIQERVRIAQDNPQDTEVHKAQIKLDGDKEILALQQKFALDIDASEKRLGQRTVKNAKEAADMVRKTEEDLRVDRLKILEESLKDAQNGGQKSLDDFALIIAKARLANQLAKQPDSRRQSNALEIDRQENIGILAREVADATVQLPVYKKLLDEKRITDDEYEKHVTELTNKQTDLAKALETTSQNAVSKITTVKELLQSKLRDIFNITADTGFDEELGKAIASTFQLAEQAMNSYFDAKKARIDQDNKNTQKQLDLELQQRQATAQSDDERNAIAHEIQLKKDTADRLAFEKDKKLKLQQAKIGYAITLVNLAVAASAYPFPASVIIFGIQAAIATASYLIQKAAIQGAQFARGGNLKRDDTGTRGGTVKGRSHEEGGNKFTFKGREYEDEVDELSIIRTKNVRENLIHTITGTHSQIASMLNRLGGGVEFKPGAKLGRKLATGGSLGVSLQAPIFTPATTNNNSTDLSGFMEEIRNLAREQSNRIDRIEVQQVTDTVTDAQRKKVKQIKVGTL